MFHILVSVLRGKLVAMFLGPAGMGVSALYLSSTTTLTQFASLGLNMAVVKETGATKEDSAKLRKSLGTIRRLTLLTSLLGALICIGIAPWLSEASFGNTTHTLSFMALGAMVFFTISYGANLAVLQGMNDVKRLSRATLWGSVCGLLISVPLYWLYGTDGIVPAMIILSAAVWLFYFFSARRSAGGHDGGWMLRRDDWPLVKRLLTLGLMLMSGEILRSLAIYAIQVFVRATGDMSDVGLFQGVNSMTMQYSGVVLSALTMDYFPRLSGLTGDRSGMETAINRQLEIICGLATAVAGAVIFAAPLVVRLLLTPEFTATVPLLRWLALSVICQAILFPMAYVPYVKEDRKVYFWVEVVGSNVSLLLLSAGAYHIFGLYGLGYAAVADNLLWGTVAWLINRHLYGLDLDRGAKKAIAIALGTGGLMIAFSEFTDAWWGWVGMGAALALAGLNLLRQLRVWLGTKKQSES